MVHSVRKYLSNRGSALFMVLSTMTALMITCMAMYFAVVSLRSAGYAVFNQQQSYQSAVSVASMVGASFNDMLKSAGVTTIDSIPVNGTIFETDGNGFKSLNPNAANIDDQYLGAYDITVTRLDDETIGDEEFYTIDIAVTTSVSGVREVLHRTANYPKGGAESASGGKLFDATGYVPNDTFIGRGNHYSEMNISTEDAIIGAYGGTEIKFFSNIYAENSITILDSVNIKNEAAIPVIHAVRGNYNIGGGDLIGAVGGSYFFVGGDMHLARGLNVSGSGALEVYVAGDLYLDSGASNLNSSKLKFYVAGDVFVNSYASNCIPGILYCKKMHFMDGLTKSNYNSGEIWEEGLDWETDKNKNHGDGDRQMSMTFSEAMKLLDKRTTPYPYMKWELNEDKLGGDIGKTKEDGTIEGGKAKEIVFKSIADPSYEPVTLTYGVDGVGCTIKDIKFESNGNYNVSCIPTIIVDTGDDYMNTYVIRLQNNSVSSKGTEYFTWSPKKPDGSQSDCPIQILVKGNGSLVIDVPEGVVYQGKTSDRIMHYNNYMLADTSSGVNYRDGKMYYKSDMGLKIDNIKSYVHSDCYEGDGCDYTITKLSEPCENNGCASQVTYSVKCSKHKQYVDKEEFVICPKCDDEYFSGDEDDPTINPAGICRDRVEEGKCISALQSIDSDSRPVNKDSKGNIVVPNCNIFMISCSESADFRFGQAIDDSGAVAYNTFIGFIYAPYMTYKANSTVDSGDFLMHMGGLVVSDYKFLSKNSFITCYPSLEHPQGVLTEQSFTAALTPVSEKKYRIILKEFY